MKVKNRIVFLTLSLLLTLAAARGYTEQSLNVAVIDPIRALETSNEGQKTMAQLQAKQKSINDELNGIDQDMLDIENRLRTQRLTLTQESQQQLAMDLDRLRTKRKRVEEDSLRDYKQLEIKLISKFKADVLPIIESVAKEKGFTLVLDLSMTGVAYFDQTIDITQEVVNRYNDSKGVSESHPSSKDFSLSKNLF